MPIEFASTELFAQVAKGGFADYIDKAARTPQSAIVYGVAVLTVIRVLLYLGTRHIPVHKRHAGFKVANGINEGLDALIYAGVFVFLIIRPYFVQAFRIPSGSMVSTLLVNDFVAANKMIYRYSDPQEGDIVVFKPPKTAVLDPAKEIDPDGQVNEDFIKRCIGVPGDIVEIKNNILYRNGQAVNEPYKHFTVDLNPPDGQNFREATPEEVQMMPVIDFKLVEHKGKIWPINIDGNLVNSETFRSASDFYVNDAKENIELLKAPPVKVPKGYYLMMGDNRNGSYDSRAWGLVPREDIVGRAEIIWLPISRLSRLHSDKGTPDINAPKDIAPTNK